MCFQSVPLIFLSSVDRSHTQVSFSSLVRGVLACATHATVQLSVLLCCCIYSLIFAEFL